MIKVSNTNGAGYMVCNETEIKLLADTIKKFNPEIDVEIYEGNLKFEQLPKEIQAEIKSTLRVYDRAYVTYENGKFSESACIGIKANYASDHYFCGEYKAEEIYTPEERKQNFIEEFGYAPCHL